MKDDEHFKNIIEILNINLPPLGRQRSSDFAYKNFFSWFKLTRICLWKNYFYRLVFIIAPCLVIASSCEYKSMIILECSK